MYEVDLKFVCFLRKVFLLGRFVGFFFVLDVWLELVFDKIELLGFFEDDLLDEI